jgi:hypothetical protein
VLLITPFIFFLDLLFWHLAIDSLFQVGAVDVGNGGRLIDIFRLRVLVAALAWKPLHILFLKFSIELFTSKSGVLGFWG